MSNLELPYLAIVPHAVLSDKSLPAAAKLYFGSLSGLAKKEGYCWASDEQLSKLWGVSLRQINRWNKALEDKRFIKRQTEVRPSKDKDEKLIWRTERKIFVNDGFSNNVCGTDKNVGSYGPDKNVAQKEEISKVKKEIIKESENPLSPKGEDKNFSPHEIKKQQASQEAKDLVDFISKKVKIHNPSALIPKTSDQIAKERKSADSLLKQIAPSLSEAYKIAIKAVEDSYKDEFWRGKIHSASYLKLKWNVLLSGLENKPGFQGKNKDGIETSNKAFILEVMKKNPGFVNAGIFEDHGKYFEISFKNAHWDISYSENGFKEQVQNQCRKWSLKCIF